jgi:hypothetical protein
MSLLGDLFGPLLGRKRQAPAAPAGIDTTVPNEPAVLSSERGYRTTPEAQLRYLYRMMWVDTELRRTILDIREMDKLDGRVKRIHARIARDTIKGGLVFSQAEDSSTLAREWEDYARRLQLHRAEKLKSDARGMVMEGNCCLQWVLDPSYNVVAAVRMPTETLIPDVDESGRFKDPRRAYVQMDVNSGLERAVFPLWQLFAARFDPENFDDLGSLGRPFLDASRTTWRKTTMTEEDLVIRRRTRAPLRLAHTLEGATDEQLAAYRGRVEQDQHEITTDYYSNKKGSVNAVQGDANLDHIKDVVHLLDTFFAGSPLPKGMMGYTDGMARDILEDLKVDYYDEIDVIQNTLEFAYDAGFRLQLLLKGINPDAEDYTIRYAQRRTETPNQVADRALKWRALGLPEGMVWEEMGLDPSYVRTRREYEAEHYDPYPDPAAMGDPTQRGSPRVSITPGNARKKESATSITNK